MNITGTNAGETLTGTGEADTIQGLGGNDRIDGGGGGDIIHGGAGNDVVDGGDGNDAITDDAGSDTLRGGAGDDRISLFRNSSGAAETIVVEGGTGDDAVDFSSFRSGSTTIDLGDGDDAVTLRAVRNGALRLTLGSGRDTIVLSPLADLDGGTVVADFAAGAGGDALMLAEFLDNQLFDWDFTTNPFGAEGQLRLEQAGADAVLWIDPDGAAGDYYVPERLLTFANASAALFTAANFGGFAPDGSPVVGRSADGTIAADELVGTPGADAIHGLSGGDTIDGKAGNDQLYGGGGGDTIDGGLGDDLVDGGDGNDDLQGGVGYDTLTGGGGDDRIDGGEGYDTAVFAGVFRRSSVSGSAEAGFTVTGPNGRDTVTGVERIQFADGVYVVDPDSPGARVIRLYEAVHGRAPDAGGMEYWLRRIQEGERSLSEVAAEFLASPEFQAAGGRVADTGEFVDFLYRSALDREADAGGRAYWSGRIEAGLSRADALTSFSESPEHRARTAAAVGGGHFVTDGDHQAVALLYHAFADRRPDEAGLIHWAARLKGGDATLGQVADAFAASAEFRGKVAGKSNGEIIDFMYVNALDRAADAGGRAYWAGRLDGGMSMGELLAEVAFSGEHRALYAYHITGGVDVM